MSNKEKEDGVCKINKLCNSLDTRCDIESNSTQGIDSINDNNNNSTISVSVCANCGKGEEESHKLKSCTACKLVKYCNRECQIAHRSQHKKECRKRAAELHDMELFKQPPSQHEDCPICFLRLPYLNTGWRYMSCCGKVICSGCAHAPLYDDQGNKVDNQKCPFCRTPKPKSDEEIMERIKKRMEANDPTAMYNLSCDYRNGTYGYPQDYKKAFELYHRAAELGHSKAYLNIGYAYDEGEGVEVDKKKAVHYYELAAMMGDEIARDNLGNEEVKAGNMERALKHYMIVLRSGLVDTLKKIQYLYSNGSATSDDYRKALKVYQEYLGEIKSAQRDEAAAADDDYRYY